MTGWRRAAVTAANRVLRPAQVRLVPDWVLGLGTPRTRPDSETFQFAGADYLHFCHNYNCGWPAASATERTVELALADAWLRKVPAAEVVEVGAVTPYYWPGRVRRVVDPADPHEQVTDRCEMDRVDLTGAFVLSVSTLEHFGSGDYGLPVERGAFRAAVDQLVRQPAAFLATVPVGYNPAVDDWLFAGDYPAGVRVGFLRRDSVRLCWREVPAAEARVPYTRGTAADAVAVVERGGRLMEGTT